MPRRRPGLARASVVLLAALALAGCPSGGPPPAGSGEGRGPLIVSCDQARRDSVQRSVALLGTLYGDEEATLSNKVTGRVHRIAADMGDVVASGAVVATLELEDFKLAESVTQRALESTLAKLGVDRVPDETFDVNAHASVVRAAAELQNARNKWNLVKDQPRGVVSEQQARDYETSVHVWEANVDTERLVAHALVAEAHERAAQLAVARQRLSDASIKAPLGARRWSVTSRFVSEGEYLKEGTPLFRVVASDPLRLKAAVPERYTPELRVGQNALLSVEAFGSRVFPGVVSRVNPSVDPANRTFGVEVVIPNPAGELRPGSFARGVVLTRTEEVTLVPIEAVVSFAGVTKVFVVEGDVARERIVRSGARHDQLLEVAGVDSGARVIVRGQTVVTEGAPVSVSAAAPAPPRRGDASEAKPPAGQEKASR
ncbi:efflux RND transporter periplasmic adaptor subunit [bacterium]|nr:efflux RND transporter periplasmic adaptor subunit [bacterium]